MSTVTLRAMTLALVAVAAPFARAETLEKQSSVAVTVARGYENVSGSKRATHDERSRTRWRDDWCTSCGFRPSEASASGAGAPPRRVIWLIRHGQATAEPADVDDGDRELTALGRTQAAMTAKRLRELIENETSGSEREPRIMVHSTMTRARQTADIIAENAFPRVERRACELIRERAPVRPEPDTWKQSEETHRTDAPLVEEGFRSIFHRPAAAADAPAATDVAAATDAARERVVHEVYVAHGNVIRYSVLRALQLPPDAWLRFGVYNASITRVEVSPAGRVSLRCMGDAGHLPPSALTWN